MKFTKETWRRSLRTFLQSVFSYIAVNLCIVDFNSESDMLTTALVGLAIAAVASGIAAVMNMERPAPEEDNEDEIVIEEDDVIVEDEQSDEESEIIEDESIEEAE